MPSFEAQWECTKLILKSHFLIELPLVRAPRGPDGFSFSTDQMRGHCSQIFGFHNITSSFGIQSYQVPFPSWHMIALQITLFFLFEDTAHYWLHRWFHTPFMYKNIHKGACLQCRCRRAT